MLRSGYLLVSLKKFWGVWRYPLLVFIGWRLTLVVIAFIANAIVPPLAMPSSEDAFYKLPNFDFVGYRLLGIWSHADGEWYLNIAEKNYPFDRLSFAFFPLYPFLVSIFGWLLGKNYLLAGILLNALFSLGAFILLYELIKHDFSERIARTSVLYLALFPTSYYLAACYTESLLLFLALAAFLTIRKYHNWWLGGILVGLAALTRNVGILLIIPFGWEWLRYYLFKNKDFKANFAKDSNNEAITEKPDWKSIPTSAYFGGVALIVTPLILFALWPLYQLIIYNNAFQFLAVQNDAKWGRKFGWPWETVSTAFEIIINNTNFQKVVPNLIQLTFWSLCFGVFIVTCYKVFKGNFPLSYLMFYVFAGILPLFVPSSYDPLLSYSRFALVIFPIYPILAQFGRRYRKFHLIYLAVNVVLLTFFFSAFVGRYFIA